MSDGELVVGTISTLSGPVPGLGASAQAAVEAHVAHRNATGGVCGRQVVLRSGDDGADMARYRSIALEHAATTLGIVGGVAGGDGGGKEVVEAHGLPVVTMTTTATFQSASTVFDVHPPFADIHAPIGKYRWLHDQGVRGVALVYTAVDQARNQIRINRAQMEASGLQIVLDHAAPLSTFSWDAAARAVANSGAEYLFFMSDAGASAAMARSMAGTGHEVRFEEYVTAYGSEFISAAGSAGQGAISWTRTLPNEDAGAVPEHAAYLEWMQRTAPNALLDTWAADSWAAAKAFFDTLEALPGPISREALLAQLRATGTYDAAGFMAPIELGAQRNSGCYVAMVVEAGAWQRLVPDEGFLC